MSRSKRLCVIIPAYNEAAVIKSVVKSVRKELKLSSYDYEVVVIDDGSTDHTANQAKAGGAKVIPHLLNSGAGAATRTGLHYARNMKFDVAATMDADGQHDPQDLIRVADAVLKASSNLVIGSRLIQRAGMPWYRVIGNMGLSIITFMVFGVNVTDSQSGLKAFDKHGLSAIDYHSNNFAFCSEMLWRAKQKNLLISEVPIRAIYSKYSLAKGQKNINALNILKHMVKRRVIEILNV